MQVVMKIKNKYNIVCLDYLVISFTILWTSGFNSSILAQTQKNWQWVKHLGSKSWDITSGVVIDSKNDIYVAGGYFDTLNCDNNRVISTGNQDLFVAIFNENGSLKKLISAGGKGNDLATCLSITPENNLALGGSISDSSSFDKIVVPGSGKSLFVAEINSKGKYSYVSTIKVKNDASIYLLASDLKGNIFASGAFSGTLESENQKVISIGKQDIFIARFNNKGTLEKLISFGGEEDDYPGAMTIDPSGNVVLAGTYNKAFQIGENKFIFDTQAGKTQSFLVHFDPDFNIIRTNRIAGEDFLQFASVKSDIAGNIYAAGSFNASIHVADTLLISKGYTDAFLLKFKPDGNLGFAKEFGTWYYDYLSNLDIDNLGGSIITGSMGDTLEIDSLYVKPQSSENFATVIQFSPDGRAMWADCISGHGRNFSNGSAIDNRGNLYFTGSFQNQFEKEGDNITSMGDQDIFIAKFYNCPGQKISISGNLDFCPGMGTELSVNKSFSNIVWNDTIQGKYNITVTKPGKYKVKLFDKKGCLLTDSVLVKQSPLPLFTLGNDTTLVLSDSLILRVPLNYNIYTWHDFSSGREFLARSTNQRPSTEEYWLKVTDSLLCTYTDTLAVNWVQGNRRNDLSDDQLVTYPNPANDRLFWYLKTDEPCQLVAMIADEKGRVLYSRHIKQYIPGNIEELSLLNLSSGLYYLKITNPGSVNSFKTVPVIKK